MQQWFLLQILLLAQHAFGHNYAHHQELESCGLWQPSAPHHTDNLKTKAPNTTGSNHLYNPLELLMMGIMVPETRWASNKICNKNSSDASSWHFISTYFHRKSFLWVPSFHADRRERDECNRRFSQLCERALKTSQLMLYREIVAVLTSVQICKCSLSRMYNVCYRRALKANF